MREQINEGYKAAMKAHDQRRTATLRSINAAIKDKDIANRGEGKPPLTDDELLVVLQKMVKQREESLGIYSEAGREDLAAVEREEIAIISEFLPKSLSETEVEAAIKASERVLRQEITGETATSMVTQSLNDVRAKLQ